MTETLSNGFFIEQPLPFQVEIGFQRLIEKIVDVGNNKEHPRHMICGLVLKELKKTPEVFEDTWDLEKFQRCHDSIKLILSTVVPGIEASNLIYAAVVPFSFYTLFASALFRRDFAEEQTFFHFDTNHGKEDFMNSIYLSAYLLVFERYFGLKIPFRTPQLYTIYDTDKRDKKYYRSHVDLSFLDVNVTKKLKKPSSELFEMLMNNTHDLALWKKHYPPKDICFKGFMLLNLFEVTGLEKSAQLKESLLDKEVIKSDHIASKFDQRINQLLGLEKVQTSLITFDTAERAIFRNDDMLDRIFVQMGELSHTQWTQTSLGPLLEDGQEGILVPDVRVMEPRTVFEERLISKGYLNILFIKIPYGPDKMAVLILSSKQSGTLSSLHIPQILTLRNSIRAALVRFISDKNLEIQAIIKSNFTTIHSSVIWRFEKLAELIYHGPMELLRRWIELFSKMYIPFMGQRTSGIPLNTETGVLRTISVIK